MNYCLFFAKDDAQKEIKKNCNDCFLQNWFNIIGYVVSKESVFYLSGRYTYYHYLILWY